MATSQMQLVADLNDSPFNQALARMGQGGEAFTKGFENQFKAMEKSIESDMDRLLRKVTADFNLAQEKMQRGSKKTAEQIAMDATKASTAAMMGGGGAGGMAGKGGNGSYRAGQVGLQAQDIAVQMEQGTNFGRILIQQGTQLASIFGPTGAIIAGLGAGAVLLYQWATGAKQAEAEMKRYDVAVQDSIKSTERLNQLTSDRNRDMVKSIYTRTRGQDGAEKEMDKLKFEEEITQLKKEQLAIEEKLKAERISGEKAFQDLQKTGFGEITSPDEAQGRLERSVEMQRKLTDELLASKAAIKAVADAYQEQEKARKANAESAAKENSAKEDAEIQKLDQMTKRLRMADDTPEAKMQILEQESTDLVKQQMAAKSRVEYARLENEIAKRNKEIYQTMMGEIKSAEDQRNDDRKKAEKETEDSLKKQAAEARKIGGIVKDAAEDQAKAFLDQQKALKEAENSAINLAAAATFQKVQDLLDPKAKKERERDKKRFDNAAREIGEREADKEDRENRKKGGRGISRERREKIIADEIAKANVGKNGGVKIDKDDMKELGKAVAEAVNKLIPV